MSAKTLLDAQGSVQYFLDEATFCADKGKGFAAMCTVFPVVLAISEALKPLLKNDGERIQAFVKEMPEERSWVVPPSTETNPIPDMRLAEILTDLRNALVHELSQPVGVILINNVAEVVGKSAAPQEKWFIGTTEFAEAVRITANRLIEANPQTPFDPKPRGSTPRAPAEGGPAPWGATASATDLRNL